MIDSKDLLIDTLTHCLGNGSMSYRSAVNESKRKGNPLTPEALYLHLHNIHTPVCKFCEKPCRFTGTTAGYSKICGSKECSAKSRNEGYTRKYGEGYDRFKHAMLKSKGVPYASQTTAHREKRRRTRLQMWSEKNLSTMQSHSVRRENDKIYCEKCGTYTDLKTTERIRISRGDDPCRKCNPVLVGTSFAQRELLEFVRELDCDTTEKKILHDRTEIDVYSPRCMIGFELNGVFWHSEYYKDKLYHRKKTELSNSFGIQLYHVWEDDWTHKREIVKSRIRAAMGKSHTRIFARKCKVVNLDKKKKAQFFENNHIQGDCNSAHCVALVYDNAIVAAMSFGKTRAVLGRKSDSIELLRFCSLLNTEVVGGASKLFSHYIRNSDCETVISYSHLSWGKGDVYEKMGFSFVRETVPNYWYVIDGERKHRYQFRKSELVKQGFDKSSSEHQIMLNRNIYRVYDCGCKLWEYRKDSAQYDAYLVPRGEDI